MSTKPSESEVARVMDLRFAIDIKKSPADVWRALTDDIGRWWPALFFLGSGRGPKRFILEARPGGRMFEDWGGGDGLVWGTVKNANAGKRLELQGATGGPSLMMYTFELEPIAAGTRLEFTQGAVGRINEEYFRELDKGWRFLLDGTLRAYLEGKEAPTWEGFCG